MQTTQKGDSIVTDDGTTLQIRRSVVQNRIKISLEIERYRNCLLHWGLVLQEGKTWHAPPETSWPAGSHAIGSGAVQSPFIPRGLSGQIEIELPGSSDRSSIEFALFYPDQRRWDNNGGHNYRIGVSSREDLMRSIHPGDRLKEELQNANVLFENESNVASLGKLAAAVSMADGWYHVLLLTDIPGPLILHWGIADRPFGGWQLPSPLLRPPGTVIVNNSAAEVRFEEQNGTRRLQLDFRDQDAPMFMLFALYQPDTNRWLKNGNVDFQIPIIPRGADEFPFSDSPLAGIAEEIIGKEMSKGSWTLMHRFNLCFDLLDKVGDNVDGLALMFVWLRFSALRQLDWQRNYNTKPRELGHSLDRLTQKLAERYTQHPQAREIIRLIMSTLGRGTDAQRVRDEVLNIMHRHHIKEVSGHFMEEWHQKLHNNTTYDDVVICQAYLEFLMSDGNLQRFYQALEERGVTRQRLENFERPIRSHPDFIPHLKIPLIHDFEHFLGILKEVHSGTDLGAAIKTARKFLDGDLNGLMDFIWEHRDDQGPATTDLAGKITDARRRLSRRLTSFENSTRDLFFLDLALENFLRLALERNLEFPQRADDLVDLIGIVLENLKLTGSNQEFANCLNQVLRIQRMDRSQREWPLMVKSVIDRLHRALGEFVDRYHQLLQAKAGYLGSAFHAEGWTIDVFSEDVIRGKSEFVLSILIRKLDPLIRKAAQLGDWQIVSPGQGNGYIRKVVSLRSIQGMSYQEPVVIIADEVAGNEEIPQGVTAVVTPQTTDIVSHLAIRARNARVLFATCYDPALIERLKSLDGRFVGVTMTAKGEVVFQERASVKGLETQPGSRVRTELHRPRFTSFAVSLEGFNPQNVGGKSNNLKRYRSKLPEWINVPVSVALPFMVFEQVLSERNNEGIAGRYEELTGGIDKIKDEERPKLLESIRHSIQGLNAPEGLKSFLREVMQDNGLVFPADWEGTWKCITTVWASKWNDRAYLSRKAMGIPDEDLFMAVLIQQVVESEYAFVVHTVNPLTGDTGEIYAEVVPGLGETLVGNYPGRALSFVCRKRQKKPLVLGFPSKTEALYGGGLIFRSDSNGEDLEHYAGAGLYDSVMLPAPRGISLDYSTQALLWEDEFRTDLLGYIALIGETIEQIAGEPQDIEGAYFKGRYYVVQTRPQVGIANG